MKRAGSGKCLYCTPPVTEMATTGAIVQRQMCTDSSVVLAVGLSGVSALVPAHRPDPLSPFTDAPVSWVAAWHQQPSVLASLEYRAAFKFPKTATWP